jgi:hypothetical protein
MHIYIQTDRQTDILAYIHTHIYIDTYIHIYMYTYVCMYVHTYVYMYVCTSMHTACVRRRTKPPAIGRHEVKHEVKHEGKHGRPLTIPMCMQAEMFPGIGRDAVPMSQYMTVYIPPSRPFKGD